MYNNSLLDKQMKVHITIFCLFFYLSLVKQSQISRGEIICRLAWDLEQDV